MEVYGEFVYTTTRLHSTDVESLSSHHKDTQLWLKNQTILLTRRKFQDCLQILLQYLSSLQGWEDFDF